EGPRRGGEQNHEPGVARGLDHARREIEVRTGRRSCPAGFASRADGTARGGHQEMEGRCGESRNRTKIATTRFRRDRPGGKTGMVEKMLSVAVIGAGIGGLAAAAALAQAGHDITVYEQAGRFARIGAGIQMMPNSMKVLRRLGVEEPLRRLAFG